MSYTPKSHLSQQEPETQVQPNAEGQSCLINQSDQNQVSAKRRAANRLNAQKSTGPKTSEGKRRSSRNAIQHGILARHAVVAVGDGQEDVAEFNKMLQQLREYYQPQNIQDELDVEELALGYLGKARAARAEMGEIRSSLDTIRRDHDSSRANQIESTKRSLEIVKMCSSPLVPEPNVPQTPEGIEYLVELLNGVEEKINTTGYALPHDPAVETLELLGIRVADVPKKEMLQKIDTIKKELRQQRSSFAQIDALKLDAHIAALALPSSDVLSKIVRYTTAIDRRLQKIRDRLEKRRSDHKKLAGSGANGGG